MSSHPPSADVDSLSPQARHSITGGILSLFVDSFDIYLPAFVLPAVMSYFEPPDMSDTMKVTVVTVIFVVTLLGRPIGGPLFGNLADRIGRKKVTMIAGGGFTVVTLLVALMPGYGTWGYGSMVGLVALRLIGGIFLGGGYSGPVPLAIERSPQQLRGVVGGVIAAGAPAAVILISIIELLLLDRLPDDQLTSWGWRLPFLFGFLLGVAYMAYYVRVPEVDLEKLEATRDNDKAPLLQLFTKENRGDFVQVFLLMTGMWFAAQVVLSFLPGLMIGVLHQDASNVSTLEIIANLGTLVAMIGFGALGQRIGRRRLLLGMSASVAIVATAAFLVLVILARSGAGFVPIAIVGFVALLLPNAPLGALVVYLNERFGAGVRSSGYGSAYTLSLILPALYSVWINGLAKVMPYEFAGVVLIALGGVLFFVGAWMGPETRGTVLLGEPVAVTPAPLPTLGSAHPTPASPPRPRAAGEAWTTARSTD